MNAAQTLLIAMPASSRLDDDTWPPRVAAAITTTSTTPAPAKAPAQMPRTPATVCQSKAMAMTAPRDAPVDTPSV